MQNPDIAWWLQFSLYIFSYFCMAALKYNVFFVHLKSSAVDNWVVKIQ